jgi:hypothetical protein
MGQVLLLRQQWAHSSLLADYFNSLLSVSDSDDYVPEITSSSQPTAVAVGTIGVLLATILLLVFLWMR